MSSDKTNKKSKVLGRGDIRHYFSRDQVDADVPKDDKHDRWCVERINTLRKQSENAPFNEAIRNRCMATNLWRKVNNMQMNKFKKIKNNMNEQIDRPPLQDFSAKPVLLGGDAIALYPSMDTLGTTELVAKAVIESKIEFKNFSKSTVTS